MAEFRPSCHDTGDHVSSSLMNLKCEMYYYYTSGLLICSSAGYQHLHLSRRPRKFSLASPNAVAIHQVTKEMKECKWLVSICVCVCVWWC